MALANCVVTTGKDGRELKEHGSAFFPIACYRDDLDVEAVPWHWHEELELLLVVEGTAEISVETERYRLEKGKGIFVNTSALHTVGRPRFSKCCMYSVVFHPRLVGGSMDSIFWQNYIQPLISHTSFKSVLFDGTAMWHKQACTFIETAWQTMEQEPAGYEFQVRSILSQVILLLKLYQPQPQKVPSERELRDAQRIRTMLQYIQEHYMEELCTAQIAGSAMVSESECLRCFHKTIGMPPIRYVKQFRIQKAAELLISTEKRIGDIAAECGFFDTSYFTKIFREMRGYTPGAYRRQQRE